jgi:hypothetical protein
MRLTVATINGNGWLTKMNKSAIFASALEIVLAASVCLNVFFYVQNQSLSTSDNGLATFIQEFGNVPIMSYNNIEYSSPISMYHALQIALESDGWNATYLQNMTITVHLYYIEFFSNASSSGTQFLHDVTQPVENYSAVQVGDATYRYVWTISVVQNENSGIIIAPANGFYYVDAQSGEIIPQGHLFF